MAKRKVYKKTSQSKFTKASNMITDGVEMYLNHLIDLGYPAKMAWRMTKQAVRDMVR